MCQVIAAPTMVYIVVKVVILYTRSIIERKIYNIAFFQMTQRFLQGSKI